MKCGKYDLKMLRLFKWKDKEEEVEDEDWKKILLSLNLLNIDRKKLRRFLRCVKWI